MLKYLVPALLFAGPAFAVAGQLDPTLDPSAIVAQYCGTTAGRAVADAAMALASNAASANQITALKARIADLEKQMTALKPETPK